MRVLLQHEYRPLLEARLGTDKLHRRMELESRSHAQVVGRGLAALHPRRWMMSESLVHFMLKATFLRGRARRNALNLQVSAHEFVIPELPPAFDGFTVLHMSDLHLDMSPRFPDILAECIEELQYDLCVLTGDYRYQTHGSCVPATEGIMRLKASINSPVYGVLGNHDSIEMVSHMEEMGIRVLLNEGIDLIKHGQRIYVCGIDDPHFFRTDDVHLARDIVPDGAVSILLSHSPEVYRQAAEAGFAVMLCGHTHGGQIRLPGGVPLLFNARCSRRVCSGAWTHERLQGYTSVGAGSSVVDARLNCRPEVTLHRLRSAVRATVRENRLDTRP